MIDVHVATHDQPIPVVFDLIHPSAPDGRTAPCLLALSEQHAIVDERESALAPRKVIIGAVNRQLCVDRFQFSEF